MSIKLRRADILDLPRIARLTHQVVKRDYDFYPPEIRRKIISRYTGRAMASSMIRGRRQVLLAETSNNLAGILVTTANIDGVAVVHWLAVGARHRGQGIAQQLLDNFEQQLVAHPVHKIMLWTEVAAGYYEKIGWRKEAVLPNHWWGQEVSLLVKYLG